MLFRDIKELCFSDYKSRGKALCLDYGDRRVGLAISDLDWKMAFPLKVLKSHGVFDPLFEIISDRSVSLLVIGLPLSLDGGKSGKQLSKVEKFTEKLLSLIENRDLNIDVLYWDERLSTVAAKRTFDSLNLPLSRYNKNIDKMAASFILQGVLDYFNYNMIS